jgi:hypothetical protein
MHVRFVILWLSNCCAAVACVGTAPLRENFQGVPPRALSSSSVGSAPEDLQGPTSAPSATSAATDRLATEPEPLPIPPSGAGEERWRPEERDDGPCRSYRDEKEPHRIEEPGGKRRLFSWHGYVAKTIRIERVIEGAARRHCVVVAWPSGRRGTDGQETHVAERIDDAWLRAIENTLARLPFRHAALVKRVVIDNRPTEHGIAPFDRRAPDDARDGHTVWLHERLFIEPNHWARGNHGAYWSYHLDRDKEAVAEQKLDHDRFSPVLLHEIGHLVGYHLVNPSSAIEETPRCARVCGDEGGCRALPQEERERGCVSPYCMAFKFDAGTENWAEQYRLYFQSKTTRGLLESEHATCFGVLDGEALNDGRKPPWEAGLPDIPSFRRSLWKSCGEKPCKKL